MGIPSPRNGLSLCAGGGGLDMGLMLAEPGFHTRCFVEWEPYPRSSIIAAQRAGYFAPAPIWDDLATFDATPFACAIDTILAGYPCQPFSMAGQRKGADDPRHLWPNVARVARELGDGLRWIFLENVAGHVTLGADTVLRELRDMGFTPAAGLFSAEEVGAPHERLRWFCVAHRDSENRGADTGKPNAGPDRRNVTSWGGENVADPGRAERRAGAETRHLGHGEATGRDQGASELEQSSDGLAQPASAGLSQRRQPGQPETSAQAGTGMVAEPQRRSGSIHMADASGTGPQGREQPRSPDQRDWTPAHGSTAERGGARLFPPGPGDAAAWGDTIATAPHLAPATSIGDCFAWARDVAQAVEEQSQAQAQSALCRMADGLASRTRALRLLGNGVVPLAAAYAWRTLATAHGLGALDLGGSGIATDADTSKPVRRYVK